MKIDYRSIIWRLVRVAIATSVAQTLALQVNWSDYQLAVRTLAVSFVTGFLVALSVGIRDQFGNADKSVGVINKLPL